MLYRSSGTSSNNLIVIAVVAVILSEVVLWFCRNTYCSFKSISDSSANTSIIILSYSLTY